APHRPARDRRHRAMGAAPSRPVAGRARGAGDEPVPGSSARSGAPERGGPSRWDDLRRVPPGAGWEAL
ncbi:MAG: hypothetical protein AVDCRST_MAG49-2872, partial [uncultured Thermomicrobiales bacterium]